MAKKVKTSGTDMTDTSHHDERMAKMTFAAVYPHYVNKVEKKGKSKAELHQVITWLTGFCDSQIEQLIKDKVNFEIFFKQANIKPNAHLIKGLICGCRVEEIVNSLAQQVRYLDKLVDELARGKKMENILRK